MNNFLPSRKTLTGEERLPNRRVIVEFKSYPNPNDEVGKEIIKLNGDGKQLDGIDIKFSVERTYSAQNPSATISIANLTLPDIQFLTTWTPWTQGQWGLKQMRIFAGYGDDVSSTNRSSLIFAGDLRYAMPTIPPDIWLECHGVENYSDITKTLSKTLDIKTNVKGVCENVAKWLGYSLVWDDLIPESVNKVIDRFNYTGSAAGLMRHIEQALGVVATVENNNLYIRPNKGVAITSVGYGTQDEIVFDSPKTDYDILCSEATGMIGMPCISPIGANITMLLNPRIKSGQILRLESRILPKSANGLYFVRKVTHEGHLRGQNFYTHIESTRIIRRR